MKQAIKYHFKTSVVVGKLGRNFSHFLSHLARPSLLFSHNSLIIKDGCLAWIRTMTSRFRDCCATVTPQGKYTAYNQRVAMASPFVSKMIGFSPRRQAGSDNTESIREVQSLFFSAVLAPVASKAFHRRIRRVGLPALKKVQAFASGQISIKEGS